MTASDNTIAKATDTWATDTWATDTWATDTWATEACYRSDVLQAVRFVCHQRLPNHWSFSSSHIDAELYDRELPNHTSTVLWALGKATEIGWCRKIAGRNLYLPCEAVAKKLQRNFAKYLT